MPFSDNSTGNVYIILEDRLEVLFKKQEKYILVEGRRLLGSALVGKKYQPLFPYFAHLKFTEPGTGAFRIVRYVVST